MNMPNLASCHHFMRRSRSASPPGAAASAAPAPSSPRQSRRDRYIAPHDGTVHITPLPRPARRGAGVYSCKFSWTSRHISGSCGVQSNVPGTSKSGGRLLTLIQVAGVAVTAWLVWSNAVLPRLRWESAADLIAEALGYVVLAWFCATAIALGVYAVV